MGAFETILILTLVGFLLLASEVFVPGMVLGLLGGVCLLAAAGVSYVAFGLLTGTLTLVGVAVATGAGFVGWMFAFPHTPMGRRFLLKTHLDADGKDAGERLLGQEGVAFTVLRPAGTALIGGRKVDVVSENDFIEPGSPIRVVREEGLRILVRKL